MSPLFPARRALCILAAALPLALCGSLARAQSFPDKPLRLIVGGPPGGAVDLTARMLAERMGPLLGQTMVVDNKPGAAGLIGVQELLRAPADGHTLMANLGGLVSEVPHVIKVPFDLFKVVVPLVEMGRSGLVLVTNTQTGAQDLEGLIRYVRANKGKVSFASYSAGTVSHTLGLELNRVAGLDMVHAGYKGSPPALQDLIGGSVQALFDGAGNVLPHVKAGKLKALATTAPQRLSLMPDVPTFAELGYRSLTEVVAVMLFVTPNLPPAVQGRLRDGALKALQDGKLREAYNTLGMATGSTAGPEELLAALRTASDKQGAMLRAIGFKPE